MNEKPSDSGTKESVGNQYWDSVGYSGCREVADVLALVSVATMLANSAPSVGIEPGATGDDVLCCLRDTRIGASRPRAFQFDVRQLLCRIGRKRHRPCEKSCTAPCVACHYRWRSAHLGFEARECNCSRARLLSDVKNVFQ